MPHAQRQRRLLSAATQRPPRLLFPSPLSTTLDHPTDPNALELLSAPPLLWNSALRAALSRARPADALALYRRMCAAPAIPDAFTLPLAVRAAAAAAAAAPSLCAAVHGHAVVLGYQGLLHVANELVVMYGKLGRMDSARLVFDGMSQRNVVSWNTLVSGFALNFDCESARGVFRMMEESSGLKPNAVTWTSLLSAHARCRRHHEVVGLFDEMRRRRIEATAQAVAVAISVCAYVNSAALEKGKEMHGYAIKSGFEGYSFLRNSLICMYGKLGKREDAESLFSEREGKNLVSWNSLISSYAAAGLCHEAYDVFTRLESDGEVAPNLVSWSAVIGGFATRGMVEQSMELFRRMLRAGVKPNSITVATILAACAESSALRFGKEIHGHTVRALMDENLLAGNGLLNMYTKSGSVRDGRLVFDRIEDKDLITWNSMIAGYGMHGLWEKSLAIFSDMVGAGFGPDEVTFISVLSACGHAGRVFEGRQIFNQMIHDYKLSPWMEHYACMVDLLGRAGLLREASGLVESMPMKPNACVLGALLNSYRMYGNTTAAEDTAMRVSGLEAEATGSYMLLSNIYASLGRWEDSRSVRVLTKAQGLKKNPGQSWIEVAKRVYAFSSGGALPPGTEESYELLDYLKGIMEGEDHVDDY